LNHPFVIAVAQITLAKQEDSTSVNILEFKHPRFPYF